MESINKLEVRTRSGFSLDVRNSTRKIVELLELDSTKFESIKRLINNYTRTRLKIYLSSTQINLNLIRDLKFLGLFIL